MGYKEIINSIQPFDYSKYKDITSKERLMLYAAVFLERNNVPLTFNYLCVAAFKFFPQALCMDEEFPEFPSVDRLNRTYMHLKYVKSGKPYIVGTQGNGFNLTPYGRALAVETEAIIANSKLDSSTKAPIVDRHKSGSLQDYDKFIASECFIKYKESGLLDMNLVWKHFNVIPYTLMSKIKGKLVEIKKYASSIEDKACVECVKLIIERM